MGDFQSTPPQDCENELLNALANSSRPAEERSQPDVIITGHKIGYRTKSVKTARFRDALPISATKMAITIAIALIAGLVAAVAPNLDSKAASDSSQDDGKILFIGDSITNWYNDTDGDIREGWWALLAEEVGLTPVTSSQGASGILRTGTLNDEVCTGTTFIERIDDIRKVSPKIIFIEVGRNDWRKCKEGGGFEPTTPEELTREAARYFSAVSDAAGEIGLTPYDVYVITPWGTDKLEEQAWIQPIIEKEATRAGFHYIKTTNLDKELLIDKSHPNYEGNRNLVDQISRNSGLIKRFAE